MAVLSGQRTHVKGLGQWRVRPHQCRGGDNSGCLGFWSRFQSEGLALSLPRLEPQDSQVPLQCTAQPRGHGWPLAPCIPGCPAWASVLDSSSPSRGPENCVPMPGSPLGQELAVGQAGEEFNKGCPETLACWSPASAPGCSWPSLGLVLPPPLRDSGAEVLTSAAR